MASYLFRGIFIFKIHSTDFVLRFKKRKNSYLADGLGILCYGRGIYRIWL